MQGVAEQLSAKCSKDPMEACVGLSCPHDRKLVLLTEAYIAKKNYAQQRRQNRLRILAVPVEISRTSRSGTLTHHDSAWRHLFAFLLEGSRLRRLCS